MASIKGGIIKAQQQQAVVANDKQNNLRIMINRMQGQIAKALPSVITPERFSRICTTAVSNNPKLADCTIESFCGAMMTAAQLGVEPNTPLGQAYLIPYSNKGRLEVQFQLGYKGLIDLAYRSGEITDISAHEVCENDEFDYEYGLNPTLRHKPALKERGEVILYYAVFHTKSGGYGFQVMSKQDIKKHQQVYSKAGNSQYSPWATNFDSMAKKTVLKQCLKYAPIKTDFVRAVASDETIKHGDNDTEDILDMRDETVIDVEADTVEEAAPVQEAVASLEDL